MQYPYCTAACTGSGIGLSSTYTNGFLTSMSQFAGPITYHANGMVNSVTLSNGTVWTQERDPNWMPRPSKITYKNGTTTIWDSGTYTYDGAGNIGTIGSDSYVYDPVGRVKSGTALNGASAQSYTYDPYGNIKTIVTNGVTRTLSPNVLTNRLAGTTYDNAGNALSYDGKSYEYDPFNMMRHASTPDLSYNWTHVYTADDERIWTYNLTANIGWWRVRDLGGKVLTDFTKNGTVWSGPVNYGYRDGVLVGSYSAYRTPSMQHFAVDHLGSIRSTTNPSKVQIASNAYLPFGEDATSCTASSEIMRFTGHERENAGTCKPVDYMHARYYVPEWGRFMSLDPGQDWSAGDPSTWNLGTYVRNSAINLNDPTGKWARDPIGGQEAMAALLGKARWGGWFSDSVDAVSNYAIVFQSADGHLQHEGIYRIHNPSGRVMRVWEHNRGWDRPKEDVGWKNSLADENGWTPAYAKDLGRRFEPRKGLTEAIDEHFKIILQCTNYSQLQQMGRSAHLVIAAIQVVGPEPFERPNLIDRKPGNGSYSRGYESWTKGWTP